MLRRTFRHSAGSPGPGVIQEVQGVGPGWRERERHVGLGEAARGRQEQQQHWSARHGAHWREGKPPSVNREVNKDIETLITTTTAKRHKLIGKTKGTTNHRQHGSNQFTFIQWLRYESTKIKCCEIQM